MGNQLTGTNDTQSTWRQHSCLACTPPVWRWLCFILQHCWFVRPNKTSPIFKTTPTTTLKTTVQTSPHRALLGVGCPSGVVNVSPPLHDFFHRACSIKKPSKLHPDPFSILSFSIYFLFLSFFISTPVPRCQHVHIEIPNPLIGTNGIPAWKIWSRNTCVKQIIF